MRRTKAIVIVSAVFFTVATAAVLDAWLEYQNTREARETAVSDIAKIVEAHIVDSVTQVDTLLTLVSKQIIKDRQRAPLNDAQYIEQLETYCRAVIGCAAMAIISPQGRVVVTSASPDIKDIDVSDRAYFVEAKRTGQLYIAPAVVTRLPGNPILFHIARPVFDPTGKLLAVLIAGMNTQYFNGFYALMGFSLSPAIGVFKTNGDVVARYPDTARYVGKNIADGPLFTTQLQYAPEGVYEPISPLDGKKRLGAYRTISKLELIVFAGVETSTAFKDWRENSTRSGYIVGFLLIIILIILYIGYRSLVRQVALEARNQELVQLSHIDGLTGIANRRFADEMLSQEWTRHTRLGTPVSVLMLDIDYFKKYNDNYGHQAGDECLRQVAKALKRCVARETDLVARYGGEEFIAILESSENGALITAQRIQEEISRLALTHAYSEASQQITISIGVAGALENATESGEALIQAADRALYRAKLGGRNTICLASGLSSNDR